MVKKRSNFITNINNSVNKVYEVLNSDVDLRCSCKITERNGKNWILILIITENCMMKDLKN